MPPFGLGARTGGVCDSHKPKIVAKLVDCVKVHPEGTCASNFSKLVPELPPYSRLAVGEKAAKAYFNSFKICLAGDSSF